MKSKNIRDKFIELRRKQAIINLRKSFGSAKLKLRLTKEQKEMIAEKHTPEKAKEIVKNMV